MSKPSLQLVENELIEAREEDDASPWYVARILKVEGRRVLIHYLNWHKRHDQWLPARSPRIRALSKQNANKRPEDQNKKPMYEIGQAIEAKWIDKHFYPGSILSNEGNDYYRVLFNDGFKKKIKATSIRLPSGEAKQEEAAVVEIPDQQPKESSRAKRLSARNSDEATAPPTAAAAGEASTVPAPVGRPKRNSARHSRTHAKTNLDPATATFLKDIGSTSTDEDTEGGSTLIIDDVIEFKSSQAPEPASEKPTEPEAEIKTDAVLQPKIVPETAEPPAVPETLAPEKPPISETQDVPIVTAAPTVVSFQQSVSAAPHLETYRMHPACKRKQDSKISVVQTSAATASTPPPKQPENSKIPIISSDEQESKKEAQKPAETKKAPEKAPTSGESSCFSDHISQLQKNQRDQSARLIAAKGVKDVVYSAGGYNPAAYKQPPVYMSHVPLYNPPQYTQYFPNTSIPNVWGVPPQFVTSAAPRAAPPPSVRLTTPTPSPQMEYMQAIRKGKVAQQQVGSEASPTTVHMSPIASYNTTSSSPQLPNYSLSPYAQIPPRKLELKEAGGKQRRTKRDPNNDNRKSHKRAPEEQKQARKIVKKSGNQAEALKKISYDIYDFPVSMTNKPIKKTTDTKSKESEGSEESESSANESENSSSATTTPTAGPMPAPPHMPPHTLPPPYYVNYPFYNPNMQGTKITNPIHQMNLLAQQYHVHNRHHLFQQQMGQPMPHKQRPRKAAPSRVPSPSKMRIHNQTIDANTAQLLRHHQLAQQQQKAGVQKVVQIPTQYKSAEGPPMAAEPPTSFRSMLEAEDVMQEPNKADKGQQPQAYLSVMKLDKNARGQGPMIESYPVHGSFKSTVPRVTKGSPKGSQPGSPGGVKKSSVPSPVMNPPIRPQYPHPAQIQKVSNPARLPPGFEMQQQIYRFPHPIGYPMHHNHPAIFKPVSVPTPKPSEAAKPVQSAPIISPKPVAASPQPDTSKPDDSISAAIQDHLTSDDLWMADDTNFDISDLANYLDGESNSAIPDDLMEQKTETTTAPSTIPTSTTAPAPKPEIVIEKPTTKSNPVPTTTIASSETTTDGVRKSLRERRVSAKLLESGVSIIPPKITVPVGNVPAKPNTITVLPTTEAANTANTPPSAPPQRKPKTPISDIHGSTPHSRRSSPPALLKGVPTSPLKQKLKQYVLERQARQAANRTPPRTIPETQPTHSRSPGSIENPLQRRMSQSPSPTNWQQLVQFGRNSPNFIASLSPQSRAALFDVYAKDPRMSPYCRTSPIPPDLASRSDMKKESLSPKIPKPAKEELRTSSPKASPSFVQPIVKAQIKEEPVEAPTTSVATTPLSSRPTAVVSKDASLHIKLAKSAATAAGEPRLSRSVPTTPEGGYNTRKIKVQTLALLGQKPNKAKKENTVKSKSSPEMSQEDVKPAEIISEPPNTLILSERPNLAKAEAPDNPFEPVFTTSSASDIISPFKDVISRHHTLPSSFDMNFDENDIFMDPEDIAKMEHNSSIEEQERCPPMQADSDLTTPLVGDITLETKKESIDPALDKKKGRMIRPRSKSTISPTNENRRRSTEEDKRKVEPRLLLARSIISESRSSKRARSSSEPFTANNLDEDRSQRKQYYYYGEPKASKAIEPLDDHLDFKCNICKKGFPKQSRLETHLKHYHEGKENEEGSNEEEEQILVRCTCGSTEEGKLLVQCDECEQWVHGQCIGVTTANLPSQYICPFCYAIVKQLTQWYDDGNLPSLVSDEKRKPNELMLSLHDMSEQYHSLCQGHMATRLKLDAFERSETRQSRQNGRKMEGTLVVIPGSGSVLLPNSTSSGQTGDAKNNNASLVYVLSPGSGKTSTTSTIRGKTVYTVNRPPLVMSLAQLRQQNPNFRPTGGVRGQLRPVSIRPSFRARLPGQQGTSPKQGVPHVMRGTVRGNVMRAARYSSQLPRLPSSPRFSARSPRMPGQPPRVAGLRGTRPTRPVLHSSRLPSPESSGRSRQRSSPRVQSPLSSPRPSPPDTPHAKSEPSTPTYMGGSRSSSPRLPGPRMQGSLTPRPGNQVPVSKSIYHSPGNSPMMRQQCGRMRAEMVPTLQNPIAELAAKQFQESLAAEISEGQDILEAHITALEKQLDEFQMLSEDTKMEPTMQLGHVLYDLEQLKILTQTV